MCASTACFPILYVHVSLRNLKKLFSDSMWSQWDYWFQMLPLLLGWGKWPRLIDEVLFLYTKHTHEYMTQHGQSCWYLEIKGKVHLQKWENKQLHMFSNWQEHLWEERDKQREKLNPDNIFEPQSLFLVFLDRWDNKFLFYLNTQFIFWHSEWIKPE